MWHAVPDSCTLTAVAPSGEEGDTGGPAFTCIYNHTPKGMTLEYVMNWIEGAKLSMETSSTPNRAVIRFLLVGRLRKALEPPDLNEIEYDTSLKAATRFWALLEEYESFIWFLSTPDFEVKAAVNHLTNCIYLKAGKYRTLQ